MSFPPNAGLCSSPGVWGARRPGSCWQSGTLARRGPAVKEGTWDSGSASAEVYAKPPSQRHTACLSWCVFPLCATPYSLNSDRTVCSSRGTFPLKDRNLLPLILFLPYLFTQFILSPNPRCYSKEICPVQGLQIEMLPWTRQFL